MVQKIDRETLKQKMDRGDDFHLVEVLQPGPYNKAHIKGAINIPFTKMGERARETFEKDDEIVVYCADTECQASPRAAEKLDAMGYVHVYDYEAGKADWMDAGYPVESA